MRKLVQGDQKEQRYHVPMLHHYVHVFLTDENMHSSRSIRQIFEAIMCQTMLWSTQVWCQTAICGASREICTYDLHAQEF